MLKDLGGDGLKSVAGVFVVQKRFFKIQDDSLFPRSEVDGASVVIVNLN